MSLGYHVQIIHLLILAVRVGLKEAGKCASQVPERFPQPWDVSWRACVDARIQHCHSVYVFVCVQLIIRLVGFSSMILRKLTATVTIARASKMASYQWVIVIKLELLLDELALVLRVWQSMLEGQQWIANTAIVPMQFQATASNVTVCFSWCNRQPLTAHNYYCVWGNTLGSGLKYCAAA